MKDFFRVILIILFCLTIKDVQAQLPPNYLGLSADSISHLAKIQHYKLRNSGYININADKFEVEYFTDFDGKNEKNSIGNSMLRCVYTFSKDKNNCIECKYGFIRSSDMDYLKKLLNKSSQYTKDGTLRTEWGWNSIDDKSYVFFDEPDYRGVYEFHYKKRLVSNILAQQQLNCLGLSADSIKRLAKKQNYKLIGNCSNDSVYTYETDFDWKVLRNSMGNSMWLCYYVFSKDKSRCIKCQYSFHLIEDVDYFTKLLNNAPHYIKDGTYRTSWGWDSTDDKSYAYIEKESDMGERFNIVYMARTP